MAYSTLLKTCVLAVSVWLTACASSPQAIQLAPKFAAPSDRVANASPVHVRVSDQRENKVLGSRGGAYPETSVVTIGNDLSLAVEKALKVQMAAMGYVTDSLSADTVDLHVIFDSLVYDHRKEDGLGYDMDMLAAVNVVASRGNEHYEGRYRIKRQQKFFKAPSDDDNIEQVNSLVVEVLTSMFEDPKLLAFLRKN
jgi:uncharacterized lipoprotein